LRACRVAAPPCRRPPPATAPGMPAPAPPHWTAAPCRHHHLRRFLPRCRFHRLPAGTVSACFPLFTAACIQLGPALPAHHLLLPPTTTFLAGHHHMPFFCHHLHTLSCHHMNYHRHHLPYFYTCFLTSFCYLPAFSLPTLPSLPPAFTTGSTSYCTTYTSPLHGTTAPVHCYLGFLFLRTLLYRATCHLPHHHCLPPAAGTAHTCCRFYTLPAMPTTCTCARYHHLRLPHRHHHHLPPATWHARVYLLQHHHHHTSFPHRRHHTWHHHCTLAAWTSQGFDGTTYQDFGSGFLPTPTTAFTTARLLRCLRHLPPLGYNNHHRHHTLPAGRLQACGKLRCLPPVSARNQFNKSVDATFTPLSGLAPAILYLGFLPPHHHHADTCHYACKLAPTLLHTFYCSGFTGRAA